MSKHRWLRTLPLTILALVFALSTPLTNIKAAEPVTVYLALGFDMTTLDPQLVEDNTSIGPVENLFLGLTDVDPKTQEIRPEMATKWTKNEAGDVWTFTLRNDVPWVHYDPATQKAEKVGMVTAQDFVFGIKRSCDPRTASLYSKVSA
jgi:oligopeptide transport system substrate-binding protein